jgi:hypothetical protein
MKTKKTKLRYKKGDKVSFFVGDTIVRGTVEDAQPGKGNRFGEPLYSVNTKHGMLYVFECEIKEPESLRV